MFIRECWRVGRGDVDMASAIRSFDPFQRETCVLPSLVGGILAVIWEV